MFLHQIHATPTKASNVKVMIQSYFPEVLMGVFLSVTDEV